MFKSENKSIIFVIIIFAIIIALGGIVFFITQRDLSEENMGVNYEYKDGLYIVDGDMTFTHRLVLTGRNPNASCDSKYIVLTNNPDITFDTVSRSLFSSNSNDWLTDTVIIGMHSIDDNGKIISSE